DPLSRAAQSPTVARLWRPMPSRAESPWQTPTAQTDQRNRGVSRWISFSIAIDFSAIFLMLQSAREVTEPIATLSQTPLYVLPARHQTERIQSLNRPRGLAHGRP